MPKSAPPTMKGTPSSVSHRLASGFSRPSSKSASTGSTTTSATDDICSSLVCLDDEPVVRLLRREVDGARVVCDPEEALRPARHVVEGAEDDARVHLSGQGRLRAALAADDAVPRRAG